MTDTPDTAALQEMLKGAGNLFPVEHRAGCGIYGNLQRDQNSTGDRVATTGGACGLDSNEVAALLTAALNALPSLLDTIDRQTAEIERLREAMRNIKPYLLWTVSEESPGHHPTMPSAGGAFLDALNPGASHDPE